MRKSRDAGFFCTKNIKYRLSDSVSVIIKSAIEKVEHLFYYINRTFVLVREGRGMITDEKEKDFICGGSDIVCSGDIFLYEGNSDEPEQNGK